MAIPGPVSSELSTGCNRLIQQGAKLVQHVDDILEELPPPWRDLVGRPAPAAGPAGTAASAGAGGDATEGAGANPAHLPDRASDDERAVWEVLDVVEPRHLDTIVESVPFGIARLQAAIFGLELLGAVERLDGGWYVRSGGAAGAR